ncbi:uncharacterized protein EI97DRAFT_44356 [Westerdykella ornata]|uniref:Uncharacterized protein n=1 Tax=Westerdykella ornata TaxID=318751 RepID=A0A6A6JJX8_WESOR|nr:uncharacterized protein EI97DRAFT_44356 [Westerdykella ornata]KAF2276564.1 hypothetical protein EI97DRAFT_44356 [Westerdykella ornata]
MARVDFTKGCCVVTALFIVEYATGRAFANMSDWKNRPAQVRTRPASSTSNIYRDGSITTRTKQGGIMSEKTKVEDYRDFCYTEISQS